MPYTPHIFAAFLSFISFTLSASEHTGIPSIVDADTLDIHGQSIRLLGIDAPESSQFCVTQNGTNWRCGQHAAFKLADHIGRKSVQCVGKKKDWYKRLIAICYLGDEDLNAWLVSSGWALAYRKYSSDYLDEEAAARQAKAGVWSGSFVMPWDWRKGKRLKQ